MAVRWSSAASPAAAPPPTTANAAVAAVVFKNPLRERFPIVFWVSSKTSPFLVSRARLTVYRRAPLRLIVGMGEAKRENLLVASSEAFGLQESYDQAERAVWRARQGENRGREAPTRGRSLPCR